VRVPPRRAVRDSERHQLEKDNAILPEEERGKLGEAETNLDMSINDQAFVSKYSSLQFISPKSGLLETTWHGLK
jgi:GntR family transcriptional regulator